MAFVALLQSERRADGCWYVDEISGECRGSAQSEDEVGTDDVGWLITRGTLICTSARAICVTPVLSSRACFADVSDDYIASRVTTLSMKSSF
jgi:hypothetical protein